METGFSFIESLPITSKMFSIWVLTASLGPLNFARVTETFGFLLVSLLGGLYIIGHRNLKWLFVLIGNRSYFIYFFHFIVLAYISKALTQFKNIHDFIGIQFISTVAVVIITIIVSLTFAEVSKRYFEGPLMRMARNKF